MRKEFVMLNMETLHLLCFFLSPWDPLLLHFTLIYIYIYISRHTIVCRAAQEAGAPHPEYINRKKENAIFTPM